MEQKKTAGDNKLKGLQGIGLVFLAAAYFYYLAGQMDEFPGQLGPAFWPKASLVLLMVGCVIKAGEIFSAQRGADPETVSARLPAIHAPRLAGLIAIILGAVALMNQIGFMLTNLIFLLFFMRLAGVRKNFTLFLTSALGTVILLYLFVKVVYLPLPKGAWFFEDLTVAVYRLLRII